MDRLLLSTREAAAALGISRDSICRMIRAGDLPAVDVGTGGRVRLRVRPADLSAYVDTHVVRVAADEGGSP